MIELKVKRLHPDAQLPVFATDGSACFDLKADHNGVVPAVGSTVIHTGLAFEVPEGHVMLLYSRSGHGVKHGVRLVNCVGVIDADYRGEVMVKLRNDSMFDFHIMTGDRVAQAMVLPVPRVSLVEEQTLSETARGAGGFGSTGQ